MKTSEEEQAKRLHCRYDCSDQELASRGLTVDETKWFFRGFLVGHIVDRLGDSLQVLAIQDVTKDAESEEEQYPAGAVYPSVFNEAIHNNRCVIVVVEVQLNCLFRVETLAYILHIFATLSILMHCAILQP